ncbi:hypothetical protein ATCC90586_004605 [Pythium insidiosum]|nr:hypothetical protein ATCC90586_004605 [Pythium insidiosum]
MMAPQEGIKTMKLYAHLDRLKRRLEDRGFAFDSASDEPLSPEVVGTMDCLHFFGDEPVRAVQQLISRAAAQHGKQQESDVRVLDLGTGYGGTARLLAHRTRCHYDVIVGLLSFMHIGQWRELFSRCFASLKPGGVLYVEDFFRRGASFSSEELEILRDDIFCGSTLLSLDELRRLLRDDIGFEIVRCDDVTDKWSPFVAARATAFAETIEEHARIDGKEAADALLHFYRQVAVVFAYKNLGGYSLVVRRPAIL